MKFFNYIFAASIVIINNSVSNRWGTLWLFQLVFIAVGFGGYVAPKNLELFSYAMVMWSTLTLLLLNIEAVHNDHLASIVRKLMIIGGSKSSEEQSSSPQ